MADLSAVSSAARSTHLEITGDQAPVEWDFALDTLDILDAFDRLIGDPVILDPIGRATTKSAAGRPSAPGTRSRKGVIAAYMAGRIATPRPAPAARRRGGPITMSLARSNMRSAALVGARPSLPRRNSATPSSASSRSRRRLTVETLMARALAARVALRPR
jgi:hypothetical protein